MIECRISAFDSQIDNSKVRRTILVRPIKFLGCIVESRFGVALDNRILHSIGDGRQIVQYDIAVVVIRFENAGETFELGVSFGPLPRAIVNELLISASCCSVSSRPPASTILFFAL